MTREPATELLADPRFELLPFEGLYEDAEGLPPGAKVALTASPDKGVDVTIDETIELAARGFEISAHVGARGVRSLEHLEAITDRLKNAGIEDLFVPGGDNETPTGPYSCAYDLFVDLDEELGTEFERIGITGYPEGHQNIDDATLRDHLIKKVPYADYIVTQITYGPEIVADWAREIRENADVSLPVLVGVPGVLEYERLERVSRKIGVGDSIENLRGTEESVGSHRCSFDSKRRYTPENFVEGIAPFYDSDEYGIEGLHLNTFNEVTKTEAWRRSYLK